MQKITIKKFDVEKQNIDIIKDIFNSIESNKIDCCNWPSDFPYKPLVTFKLFHNGDNLFIKFDVTEIDIHAIITEDFGQVWTDPCVEFFLAFDNNGYYNFECTCIGRLLASYRKERPLPENLSLDIMNDITRISSLGNETFDIKKGETSWHLIEIIPTKAIIKHNITKWDGIKARANFYKCGDNLPNPHFISWNAIDTLEPNFHVPQFFGEIEFE